MGAAAYRRGSKVIREQIDRELAEKRRAGRAACGGTYRNGPEKKFARCTRCGHVDYEKYEGDKHR